MSRLFDISQDFETLFDQFDSISEYEFELNEKGEPIDDDGNVVDPETIKCLKAEVEVIDTETKKLRERRDSRNKRIERLKIYLMNCMQAIGVKKIDMPRAKITIRNNAAGLKIDDEIEFINMFQDHGRDDLLKYSLPEIKKSEIKKLIKSGETFDGARLEAGQSVIIS